MCRCGSWVVALWRTNWLGPPPGGGPPKFFFSGGGGFCFFISCPSAFARIFRRRRCGEDACGDHRRDFKPSAQWEKTGIFMPRGECILLAITDEEGAYLRHLCSKAFVRLAHRHSGQLPRPVG